MSDLRSYVLRRSGPHAMPAPRGWARRRVDGLRRAAGGLAVIVALALGSPAAADVVTLEDGRVIEGEIISEAGAAVVEIRIQQGGLSAVQRIDRRKIVKIEVGPSPRQQALASLRERRSALTAGAEGGTAAEWMALAKQAKELGEMPLARELAAEALARDRHDEDAHRLLGESKQNGVWMRPREAAVARGQVYFRGRWVAWLERDQTLAQEVEIRRAAEEARRKLLEQRAADAALVAASRPPEPSPGYHFGVYQSVPANARIVYWPSAAWCPPGGHQVHHYGHHHHHGHGLSVAGAGRIGSTRWTLNWRW